MRSAPPPRCGPRAMKRSSRRCCGSKRRSTSRSAPDPGRRYWSPAPMPDAAIAFHERAAEIRAPSGFHRRRPQRAGDARGGFGNVTSCRRRRERSRGIRRRADCSRRAPLLYLAGEERSGDLAGELRNRGFTVETVVVYRAVAAPNLPQDAAEALTSGIGVLHFSRRSAEAYLDAARSHGPVRRPRSSRCIIVCRPGWRSRCNRPARPMSGLRAAPTEAHLIALIDGA